MGAALMLSLSACVRMCTAPALLCMLRPTHLSHSARCSCQPAAQRTPHTCARVVACRFRLAVAPQQDAASTMRFQLISGGLVPGSSSGSSSGDSYYDYEYSIETCRGEAGRVCVRVRLFVRACMAASGWAGRCGWR